MIKDLRDRVNNQIIKNFQILILIHTLKKREIIIKVRLTKQKNIVLIKIILNY